MSEAPHHPDRGGVWPAAAAGHRGPGRDRGVVLVLALLGLVLLAAMVFYVFNIGNHVSKRIETQNAADNAALSGSRWTARTFNTVAMNNVESSRMIALAAVLDAVPMTVQHTLEDQTAFAQATRDQIARLDRGVGLTDDPWLRSGLVEAVETFDRQIELLRPVHELFNESGYDIARMTHYQDANGLRGELWRSIESMNAISRAAMENLAVLAPYSAHRGAQISQRESGFDAGGLLLPWESDIPWEAGGFDDFENPVTQGLLPPEQDDPVINRGPYDTVFGFWQMRSFAERRSLDVTVDQDYTLTRWAPQPPTQEIFARRPNGYLTWGAYTDMRANAMSLGVNPESGVSASYIEAVLDADAADATPLVPSQWARRLGFTADQKINNAFPGAANRTIVREPQWVTDYDAGVVIEAAGVPQIGYGAYLVFEYQRTEIADQTPSTPILSSWGLLRVTGDYFNPPGLARIGEHVWKDERLQSTPGVGGERVVQRFFRYYVFLGVNTGREAEVRNPFNFTPGERAALPGPINFTVGEFPPDEATRREHLTFLGVAHQPRRAAFWSDGFDGRRPDDRFVALAQAEVFNNHSWDLWTQMWHAQLTPVDGIDGWMNRLDEPEGTDQMPWLDANELEEVADYLTAVRPLIELMGGDR
ncbi:MAG: pilus assembly protein TadG-related protein [Planctomycetota bacterium]